MQFPFVTIITSTLNPNIMVFQSVLNSIRNQKFPKHHIQHIVLDGGSVNGAVALAKEYGCIVKTFHNSVDEGGSRLFRTLKDISGDFTVLIQSDNILPDRDWLIRMVEPFQNHTVFATNPAYNTYTPGTDILNRYFALIGAPDPTLYYLEKSDKIPMMQQKFDKGIILKETKHYWIVRFDRNNLPTMGDNGTMIRTGTLRKVVSKNKPFIHVDAYMELLKRGYDTYGIVKNSIIHISRLSIIDQVKRRIDVKRVFTDDKRGTRSYLVYNSASYKDQWNVCKYIVCSLTVIQPLAVSIRGYMKRRDIAWFLHPIMSFLMVVAYGYSEIVFHSKNALKRLFVI